MKNSYWSRRFQHGDRVQFLDDSGEVLQLGKVFACGDGFLHFYLENDSELIERLKFTNAVTVRSLENHATVTGQLSVLDHRPSLHDSTNNEERNQESRTSRLVRFRKQCSSFEPEQSPATSLLEIVKPWGEILHLRSLPATIIPILLGCVYALWMNWESSVIAGILGLMGGVLLHSASNLHNDLSDYHWALMNGQAVENYPVNRLDLNPGRVWFVAMALYGLAILPGIPLLYWRGADFLFVGCLGFLIASFYTLHRHFSAQYPVLRDFMMFVLMGPLMAVASSIAVSGHWDLKLAAVAIPVGLFVALILHEDEIHNIPIDRRAGATTLAILLGFRGSKLYYLALTVGGYFAIGLMVILGFAPKLTRHIIPD